MNKIIFLFVCTSFFQGGIKDFIFSTNQIKSDNRFDITSAVAVEKECFGLVKTYKKGFFGHYYFLNRKLMKLEVLLVVNEKQMPWNYSSKSEIFCELTCEGTSIKFADKLGVNSTKKEIEVLLGPPVKNQGSYFLYKAKNYLVAFKIEKEKVIKFRFGVYENFPARLFNF